MKKLQLKEKKQFGTYLQLAVSDECSKSVSNPDTIKDLRFTQTLFKNRSIFEDIDLLVITEKAKDELISFLLTKTISSSLDFHFVLMTLNKLE